MSNKNSTPSMIICTVGFFSNREGLTLKDEHNSLYPPEDSINLEDGVIVTGGRIADEISHFSLQR